LRGSESKHRDVVVMAMAPSIMANLVSRPQQWRTSCSLRAP
jgi:hypothetical protein